MWLLKMITHSIARSLEEKCPIYLVWVSMPDGESERLIQMRDEEDRNWDFKCDGPIVTVSPEGLATIAEEVYPE